MVAPNMTFPITFSLFHLAFKPLGDEMRIHVAVNLPQLSISGIHERMRYIRRHNHDLPGMRFKDAGTNSKGDNAFLYDEFPCRDACAAECFLVAACQSTQIKETSVFWYFIPSNS